MSAQEDALRMRLKDVREEADVIAMTKGYSYSTALKMANERCNSVQYYEYLIAARESK